MEVSRILEEFLHVSISLSREKNTKRLLENILLAAKRLANADGGTIYSINAQRQLEFDTIFNDSLSLHIGGSSDVSSSFSPVPIYLGDDVNRSAVAAICAATGSVINIQDVYSCTEYDMERTKAMDVANDYHTVSMLTIPMKNHEGELNGVLQLINAQEEGKVVAFNQSLEFQLRALTSLASVALTNKQLLNDMESLFHAFTQVIAKAIDEKSPYTAEHCKRVPALTMMLAEAVHRHEHGPLADFQMTDDDRRELDLAGWIHDCGKVATPEYIMDKATKLETICDRIAHVETRFELAKYQLLLADKQANSSTQQEIDDALNTLDDDLAFVKQCNQGGEYLSPEEQLRLENIGASMMVTVSGESVPLLTADEIHNLKTSRGTLNPEEREIVNRHMDITIEMLDSLPFPKHLSRVPEFAGGHHEKMDGTGYPKQLTRDEMSVQARMMAIADIFEALSAADRPYKPAKKISECLMIMGKMKLDHHIDPDLFDVFVREKVYEEYALEFLSKDQLDEISWEDIPGFGK